MLRGIDIVTIPVRDQDIALKFYTEKLGFKVATNQYFGEGKQRWIELLIPGAESRLALFTPEGFENRIGGFQPVTFRCDDVYATAEVLKSRGVKLAAEPKRRSGERWRNSETRMEMNSCFRANRCQDTNRKVEYEFDCEETWIEIWDAGTRARCTFRLHEFACAIAGPG